MDKNTADWRKKWVEYLTRLEGCTLWSTVKFLRRCPHHITGNEVSRAIKGIANSTVVKGNSGVQEHRCNNVI
jgi:hypothetical protein